MKQTKTVKLCYNYVVCIVEKLKQHCYQIYTFNSKAPKCLGYSMI